MAKHSEDVVRHLSRNDACWCGSGRKYKTCHAAFDDKLKKYSLMGKITPDHSILKTPEQVAKIKESCAVNIAILDRIEKEIHEGMATSEIDKIVYDMSVEAGGIPAPLNYEGYPYSVCTSVNEQVCHGFPSDKVILKSGDIVNVDCSTILNGFFSDSSRMFMIGDVDPKAKCSVSVKYPRKSSALLRSRGKPAMKGSSTASPGDSWAMWDRLYTITATITVIPW